MEPRSCTILCTFSSSPGHVQVLNMAYCRSGATRAADIHARLLLAAFAYASELVSQDFKRRAVIQLRELLSPTVIAFEEAAESLGSAVLKVMAGFNTDALGTMEAFETLKRLKAQMQGLPAREFQVGILVHNTPSIYSLLPS